MQRGSGRLNVHRDDEMKRELAGLLRSGHSTRAEEWNDPEPAADDDPLVTAGPVPGRPGADPEESEAEALRFELARHLGRGAFPADRRGLMRTLLARNAPDRLVDAARALPSSSVRYRTVQEVVDALGRHPRA